MGFGIPGVTAPAQTAPANPILELNPADPAAGSPAAKPAAPTSVDTVTRRTVTMNPNAYHEAIAKFSGGADATGHTGSAPPPTATTRRAATTAHPPATKQTQVASVSSTDHAAKANQSVADRSLAAKVSTAPPPPPSVRSTNDRVHAAQPHEQRDPLQQLSQSGIATMTAAVSRGSAIAQGALEFNPALLRWPAERC